MRTFIANLLLIKLTLVSFFIHATPLNVEVVYAKQQASNLELELSGNVRALNDAQLTSLESGIVRSVNVEAGDQVNLGQVLIELDDSLAMIELEQAKAVYQSALVTYQEDLRLYNEIIELTKKEVIAKTQLAQRKANLANSEALRAQAKAKLHLQQEIVKRHTLRAPFAGTIAKRDVDVGEWISQQSQVLQLVSDDSLRIFVDIPQEYFSEVKYNNNIDVLVTPDTAPNTVIKLALSQFINVSNPISRTFMARIDLPKNTEMVSGMSAKVRLILPRNNASQVTLPKSTLKRHPDGSYSVYAVENNKIKRYGINLLRTKFDQVIVQGVPENTAVISSGNELLIEGTSVSIDNNKGAN